MKREGEVEEEKIGGRKGGGEEERKVGRMYTCIETKCSADNEILPVLTAFRRVTELGILYGLPGKLRLITGRKRAVYSPYNRILLSTSPREFLAAHRYVPTSCFCRFRMVRIIRTSNCDFATACTSCLTLDIIIAPWEQSGKQS